MKMADILHNIADMLDQEEDSDNAGKTASDFQHNVHDGADSGDDDTKLDQNPIMVPPLQAKIELLKKATGVDNVYDDELSAIKQLTGLKSVIAHEAGEDEPLDV